MDRGGRIVGMVVFVLGIIVLLFVFVMALNMFTSPIVDLAPVNAVGLGSALALILVRVALLFIMALAGSLIASRGIQLYLGSREPVLGDGTASSAVEPRDSAGSGEKRDTES